MHNSYIFGPDGSIPKNYFKGIQGRYINNIKQPVGNRHGFTLLETMVALLLIFVVLAMANAFFVLGMYNFARQCDRAEVQENLRIGINRLSRELRHATQITYYESGGGGQISFTNTKGETINYKISKSTDQEAAYQLNRSIRGAGHNPVARYVDGLQVQLLNNESDGKTVTVTLTGAKNKSEPMAVRTTVTLRN